MKAIKPRGKSKKSNGRFGRVKFSGKESAETNVGGPDLSQLRKPIDISVSSLIEVTKLLEVGGDEIKSVISYECDIVYECRVCRSLFRSLANFVSHKRVYCTEKFNVSAICRKTRNDQPIPVGTTLAYSGNGGSREDGNIRILRSQATRESSKKDLTSVVDMLQKKRREDINETLLESSCGLGKSDLDFSSERGGADQQVLLEPIDSTKTAVYQTATSAPALSIVHTGDLMKAQIVELQKMVGRNTAVLNPEGKSVETSKPEKSNSPMQIYSCSDEEEGTGEDADCTRNLVCTVCNAKFSTRKTLTYHIKSLHVSYRTCYPCPCCSSTFANSWSVYRHLFKVHRKTNEQVRKLRRQIQEKAFRKETTGAEDIEKENAGKSSSMIEQQTSNNTQEWMEHFELDLELQRCGGCGRRFDRRAALISHAQTCQKRIAACNEASGGGQKGKRLSKTPSPKNVMEEIVERNLSAKEDARTECVLPTRTQSNRKQIPRKSEAARVIESPAIKKVEATPPSPPEIINNSETSIRVENVSRISDADWEMIGSNLASRFPTNGSTSPVSDTSIGRDQSQSGDEFNVPDSPEIIFTSIDKARTVAISFGPKKRKVSLIDHSANGSGDNEEPEQSSPTSPSDKETNSTDHMIVMAKRMATISNLKKLQCLPCRRKFTSTTNLRRHMAIHIGWNRYRCKLCDFKCFAKCDCVVHCNKVHDAKNNRSVIADMMVQIPSDQVTLGEEIITDLLHSDEANLQPEIIDVSASSPKPTDDRETRNSNGVEPQKKTPEERYTETRVGRKSSELSPEQPTTIEKVKEEKEERPEKPSSEEPNSEEGQGRLDKDPDLRKMVMEVIFGTSTNHSAAYSESEEVRGPRAPSEEVKNGSKAEESSPASKLRESPATKIVSETRKSGGCLGVVAVKLDDIKRQRPTRNRVKPVNEDFIYDLAEVIRKESAIHRATAIAAQKTLKKKQSSQNESKADSRSESVLPNLLSCKKGSEASNYSSRFSLKQAEIKLIPSISTKIAVSSSQK